MPAITLPDGSQRQFDNAVTVMAVAADIGPGLAKATLAGEVDGVLRDASHLITGDAELRIITGKDPEGLEIIRHSTAHLMAMGVMHTDLKDTELMIVMISPGRVDTQLMRDSGWTGSSISASESANLVIDRIANLDREVNGRLILYTGRIIPW